LICTGHDVLLFHHICMKLVSSPV